MVLLRHVDVDVDVDIDGIVGDDLDGDVDLNGVATFDERPHHWQPMTSCIRYRRRAELPTS